MANVNTKISQGWVDGKNGLFNITGLEAYWSASSNTVFVEGIGKRGKPIKGGFGNLKLDELNAFCKAFLEAQGYKVIPPNEAIDPGNVDAGDTDVLEIGDEITANRDITEAMLGIGGDKVEIPNLTSGKVVVIDTAEQIANPESPLKLHVLVQWNIDPNIRITLYWVNVDWLDYAADDLPYRPRLK